jgi:hypothetical protein
MSAEGDRDDFRTALATDDPEAGLGLLEVREPSSTYLRSGIFSPDGMLELIDNWSREVFDRDDCSFARVAGDMGWAGPACRRAFRPCARPLRGPRDPLDPGLSPGRGLPV